MEHTTNGEYSLGRTLLILAAVGLIIGTLLAFYIPPEIGAKIGLGLFGVISILIGVNVIKDTFFS